MMVFLTSQDLWEKIKNRYSQDLQASYRKRSHASIEDLRLLFPAIGVWAVTSCIIVSPHLYQRFIVLSITAFVGILLVRTFHLAVHKYLESLVLILGMILVQGLLLGTQHQLESFEAAHDFNNKSVEIAGTVRTAENKDNSQVITFQASRLQSQDQHHYFDMPVSFTAYGLSELRNGDYISVRGKLQTQGVYYRIKQPTLTFHTGGQESVSSTFKKTMRDYTESILDQDEAALAIGMTYGDDSGMTDATSQDFKTTGLTHLTAVSGANITLVFVLGYRLLQFFRCNRTVNITISAAAIVVYVVLVGTEPSVLRAMVMGLLGAIALISGSGRFSSPMLWTAVIGLLMVEPRYALDFGFALSVTATASLIILAPALVSVFSIILPRQVAEILAIPISAALWCTPIMVLMVESYQTYSVPANILATFLVAPVTVLGLLATILVFLGAAELSSLDFCVQIILHMAGLCCRALINIAHRLSDLPLSAVPIESTWWTIFIIVALVSFLTLSALKARYHLEQTAFYTYRGSNDG